MLSKRSLSALTLSEKQALHYQWLRSGRCTRCFHTSRGLRAPKDSKDSNDAGTPFNAPKRGPTRQQRAAMVSKEVQMLQRDRPSPSFGEPDPNTLRPPGASRTVDPEAVGLNVGYGRMGENDSSTQEGPLANQGVNMNVRNDVDAGADTRAARSTGQPVTVESSAERAGSGLEGGLGVSNGSRLTRPTSEDEDDEDAEDEEDEEDEDDVPDAWTNERQVTFRTESLLRDELLHGRNGSTIAASNFEGIIDDRLNETVKLSETSQKERLRILTRRLVNGHFVHFKSREEKAAVLQFAKDIARRRSRSSPKPKSSSTRHENEPQDSEGEQTLEKVQPPSKVYSVAPLPANVQKVIVDKMVKGEYDAEALLSGTEKHKIPVLNAIARATKLNGTYLNADQDRLLQKVRSLLPAGPSQHQQQQQRRKAGA